MTTESVVAESTETNVKVEESEHPSKDFLEIFEQLDPNINGELIEKAWKLYDTISQQVNIDLEVWMACAFYTTVWTSTPIGQETVYKFSLSKLLSICNLSVLEFFEKLNKWAAMIVASRRLLDHLNRVQSNLAVTTVVYKKFLPIFRKVFINSNQEEPTNKSKYATQPFSSLDITQLFEFIWIAYIALKKQLGNSKEDLMHSYHLLLCLVELIFENIQAVGLTRLYNLDFAKTLETHDATALEYFCEVFEGVVLDAKHFRTHWLKPKLKKLHDDGLILRDCNLNDNSNNFVFLGDFRNNRNAFEKLYEEAMLKRAEVDERILITSAVANIETVFNDALDASAITMLKRCNLDSSWAIDAELLLRMSTQTCLEKLSSTRPAAPTSQANAPTKTFVMGEQFCPVTPISAAEKKVQKLQNLLVEDFRNSENEFDRLLGECPQNPKNFIADRVVILQNWFEEKLEEDKKTEGANFDGEFNDAYNANKELIPMLFYRILQRAVMYDRERNLMNCVETTNDLGTILLKEDFIGSLWICALELVLFTYSSRREFPWSASAARVAPVNFYKIVELVVRSEPELSRDMIKHLNKVEERVIEELAWAMDSPLWGALAKYSSQGVPSCRSVALTTSSFNNRQDMPYYQGVNPSTFSSRYNTSPMKPYEQRGMPIKRRYEEEYEEIDIGPNEEEIIQPRTKRHLPEDFPEDFTSNEPPQVEKELPSSITLFFRKVYYLAVIRLTDLCDRIRMDEPTRQKVWTLFEHLLRVETSLMAGRHLDQNLMCCVYIVAKICGSETAFQDILYNYRHQPQAISRIYRCVLMDSSISPPNVMLSDDGASRDSIGSVSGGKFRSNSVLPPPGTASAPPTPEPHNLEYNDLIKYYNRIFVGRVEEFVKKLNPTAIDSKENIIALNPMPKVSCNTLSPRRLINEQINLIPYTTSNTLQGRPARYNINRSPSKDLKNINAMVRGGHMPSHQMIGHGY